MSRISAAARSSCRLDHPTPRWRPTHVDRSKLFVIERLDAVDEVDAGRIARAIEYTRFPYTNIPKGDLDDLNEEEGLLLRAADLIGQLGDPNYMRKSNALFRSNSSATGLNKSTGLRHARGHRLQVPALLLDQRRAADPACDHASLNYFQRSPQWFS